MTPILSHFECHLGFDFWVTTDFRCGLTIELDVVDSEVHDFEALSESLSNWARRLDPRVLVRLSHESKTSNQAELGTSRDLAVTQLGFSSNTLILSLETNYQNPWKKVLGQIRGKQKQKPDQAFEILLNAFNDLKSIELPFQASSPTDPVRSPKVFDRDSIPKDLFVDTKHWVVCDSVVDLGDRYRACVRLLKPKFNEVSLFALQEILMKLPRPFCFQSSFQRLSSQETQMMLSRRIKQSESMDGLVNQEKLEAVEQVASSTAIQGDSLFSLEVILTLDRNNLTELKSDLGAAKSILETLGESSIETFGALPSLSAAMIGSPQHIPFFETGSNLSYYLPVFAQGQSSLNPEAGHGGKKPKSSCLIHRVDDSLGEIDLLAPIHQNANAVVVGASGRGKSALVGTLTQALLNAPQSRIIKVDVGGSHSKECQLMGGMEHRLSISESSGINPFRFLQNTSDEESLRAILNNFISVLILEENETSLPKSIKVELDELLKSYLARKVPNPSLNSFFEGTQKFSRRSLLSRWVDGGIFARAFSGANNSRPSRLTYYNLSEIFQAADPDFAQAGMAAVLAQFNLEMREYPENRIILICDETPFFIKKCFEFFKFSTANVRKFGASVVLIVQMSKDLIVNQDPGLIENSYHRLLLSSDGDDLDFQNRFKLTEAQMNSVRNLRTVPREYSEFFYQFGEKGFKGRLKLTPKEYFQITTSQSEKLKIEKLMTHVPGLTLEEAISCLAI